MEDLLSITTFTKMNVKLDPDYIRLNSSSVINLYIQFPIWI